MSDRWRSRHPFLYGLSQTFGIFPIRRPVPTVQDRYQAALDDIEWAIKKVTGDE